MNDQLKAAFHNELRNGKNLYRRGFFADAFKSFERSHILGQEYVVPHTLSHIWMLRIGIKTRNLKEIIGQLSRLPLGVIGSAIGIVPLGNTGGSNVNALKKMPIPKDLEDILNIKP
jgi:hypothetical protein